MVNIKEPSQLNDERIINIHLSSNPRNDQIGPVNKLLNWVFMGKKSRIVRRLVGIIFHIEPPSLVYPLCLPHPFGIIVNDRAKLGRNVKIFQHVTIGNKPFGRNSGVATIGDDVVIYPNAVLVGGILIGAGAVIAPGSVVIADVPAGATVAGNPARIISPRAEKH